MSLPKWDDETTEHIVIPADVAADAVGPEVEAILTVDLPDGASVRLIPNAAPVR